MQILFCFYYAEKRQKKVKVPKLEAENDNIDNLVIKEENT